MTLQQVNLYTAEFRPRKNPLAAKNMLIIVAIIWVLGAAYAGWLHWDKYQLQQLLAAQNTQNEALENQIDDYEAQLAARSKDKFLDMEQSKLRLRLKNTRGLLDAIATGMDEGGNRIAFASILVALAKHQLEPLWLEQISILAGGERVVLTGSTTQPEAVPLYLQSLGRESAFSGRAFNEFSMEQSPEDSEGLRQFTVDTQNENDPELDTKTEVNADSAGLGASACHSSASCQQHSMQLSGHQCSLKSAGAMGSIDEPSIARRVQV